VKEVPPAQALPLQLCDVTTLIAALALWFRRPLLVELTYFWGLAGSFQGLLTPDLPQHFPSYEYVQYYIGHGGIVVAALLLVVGMRLRPRPLAVVWVGVLAIAYAGLLFLLDAATGANYMYLTSKPPAATLLDLMGPWPRYLVGASVLGILLLAILEAPFYVMRRRSQADRSRLFGLPIRPSDHLPCLRRGDPRGGGEVSGGTWPPSPDLVLLFDGT
jgi:hypothetical integral membrane protein (TIGR02206 family)